jgi:hypothetical protein
MFSPFPSLLYLIKFFEDGHLLRLKHRCSQQWPAKGHASILKGRDTSLLLVTQQ